MCPLVMSTVLLALSAPTAPSAGASQASNPVVVLELRSAADVGPQATAAKRPAEEPAIEVAGGAAGSTFTLLVCDNPAITASHYVVRGRVKYNDVAGDGYLELLNDFGDKGTFFTRSVEDSGPVRKLTGTSDWREFELPFFADAGMKPQRLTLNVVLPGAGKVTVAQPLELSDDNARPKDPAGVFELRSAADAGPGVTAAKGPAGELAIEVAGGPTASTSTLAICENPATTSSDYVVRGRVKYTDVTGDGYLELLNDFGDKGVYFSRSLANAGPMKKLTGTSDWRDFELPFHAEPGMKPRRLTLNVFLPGGGKVIVTQPLVVAPLSFAGQWWTPWQTGGMGASFGIILFALGGLIGLSTAWCKSRRLTASLLSVGLALSAVLLVAGLVAWCAGQPEHVTYPLFGAGAIGACVFGLNLRSIFRRFQADELRRMTAADVI